MGDLVNKQSYYYLIKHPHRVYEFADGFFIVYVCGGGGFILDI